MKIKVIDDKKNNAFIIDRSYNQAYYLNCASLSFHKSLVGLSELRALEENSKACGAGGLRMSRALSTYYSVYHLLICMILLDSGYELRMKRTSYLKERLVDGYLDIGVDLEMLNDPSELPEVWKRAGTLEQDLASMITHTQVSAYCKHLRDAGDRGRHLPDHLRLIYSNYARTLPDHNKSIEGLYDKLCYIRDRSIYRPSIVLSQEGEIIHTSLNIRKEIENLPDSKDLYAVIKDVLQAIVDQEDKYLNSFVRILWLDHTIDSWENVTSLGYAVEDVKRLKNHSDQLSFATYVTHLMELVDPDRIHKDLNDFWNPLREISSPYNIV
jgi:hypothetical protein